ncbi:GntR family transcriptional regulator [Nocardioides baekrokdamisoli]|uniref:GntR family transcriptional regulator n=1 Tax=Nocardioides baekrokdamisoli TaxID=1804624 RepID=A0A3G9IC55_9ACTN|nr:GntR family transcriptional regulator [Nocardioides baekrokdamisoli]BBH16487.1 GntR family transcriptional regulator [Nocardioides baekrokdamisoli]
MSVPLHVQVAADLRDQIASGGLAEGESLPSEAQLVQRYGASRGTVRAALQSLRREGLIAGGQGRPPVVRGTALGQPFESLLSFSAWVEAMGRRPGQRTIEIARRGASPDAAAALDLEPGEPVIEVLRVRYLDDEPVMLERASYIEPVGRLLFDFDPDRGSIYAQLTKCGVDLHGARHTIDALPADELDSELLEIEVGVPLLRERRRATTAEGAPLEYADDRYRPDRVTFTIDNTRPSSLGMVSDLRILKESS